MDNDKATEEKKAAEAKKKSDKQANLLDIEPSKHKESAAKDLEEELDNAEQSTAKEANRQTS